MPCVGLRYSEHSHRSCPVEWTNVLVYIGLASLWARAWNRFQRTGRQIDRRRVSQWMWALLGALFGSATGFVGYGTAIAGTIIGAVFGYLLSSHLHFIGRDSEEAESHRKAVHDVATLAGRATGLAVVFVGSLVPIARRLFRAAVMLSILGGIGMVILAMIKVSQETTTHKSAPSAAAPVDPVFSAAIDALQLKYPQLKPGSPTYDPKIVEAIEAQREALRRQGYTNAVALTTAAEQYFKEVASKPSRPPRQPPPQQIRAPSQEVSVRTERDQSLPKCQYKSVMSDDDYRNCGLPVPDPSKSR